MPDIIHLPLDEGDRLAVPPLLDLLRDDPLAGAWAITFVPSDDVSDQQNESIIIKKQSSSEARYIQALMNQVQELAARTVSVISHLGGADYTLGFTDGSTRKISDYDNAVTTELFDRLRQIALIAEFRFRIENHGVNIPRRPAI